MFVVSPTRRPSRSRSRSSVMPFSALRYFLAMNLAPSRLETLVNSDPGRERNVVIGRPTHLIKGRWAKKMPLPMPKINDSVSSTPLSRNSATSTPLSQWAE